jgi:activator of HSP90 ATPase
MAQLEGPRGDDRITGARLCESRRQIHRVWDGYISGKNLKLVPGKQIVQAWRTTEFAGTEPDSQIDIHLEATLSGTRLTLRHTNIPTGQSDYRSGWNESYFSPMKACFSKRQSA